MHSIQSIITFLYPIISILCLNYRGLAESGGDIDSISCRVNDLKEKLEQLKSQEEELDRHCRVMTENLKQTRNDPTNQYYAYATRDDFVTVFGSDDVVLTIRNYDSCDSSPSDDVKRQTLRLYGRWKSIDVRLVTDEGDSMRTSIHFETKTETEKEQNGSNAVGVSSSQPVKGSEAMATMNKRRAGRRKRHIVKEDDEDNDVLAMPVTIGRGAEKDVDERLAIAQALLGFRPTRKHLKRNLDDASDSFECR